MSTYLDEKMKEMEENSIEECDLRDRIFTPEEVKLLTEILVRNTSVKVLRLGNLPLISYELTNGYIGNYFDNESAMAITDALTLKPIRELYLDNSEVAQDANAMANVLRQTKTLVKLNLKANSIAQGAIAIVNALNVNRTLVKLSLKANSIENEGAIAIANALTENKTLHVLILNENNIGDEGCIAIAKALTKNSSLMAIQIGGNKITSRGAKEIGNALKSLCLSVLEMPCNYIGDEGVEAITEGLKKNRRLQQLDLRSCRITDVGLFSIAELLKVNFTLWDINLSNMRYKEGANSIVNALKFNVTLGFVSLGGTGVSVEVQELICQKAFRRNWSLSEMLREFKVSDLLVPVPFRKTKIILLGDSGSGKTHTVRELTSEEYVEERDRCTEALEINCVNSMSNKWEKDDQLNARELSLASLRGELVAEEVHSLIKDGDNETIEPMRGVRGVLDIEEEEEVAQWSSYTSHLNSLMKGHDKEKKSSSDPRKANDSDERAIVADIYDFGGHEVYRVVSHFFMNNWAVYLIVLNLENSLDELREQLSYYVSVVQTFAPEARICVVGTHSATRSVEKDELEEILEEVSGEADCPVFLVENGVKDTEEEGEDEKERLKATVKEIIENMMQEKRPTVTLLWTRMLDHLRRKRENEGVQVMTKYEMREIELGRAFDKDDEEKAHPSIVKFLPKDVDAFIQRMKEMGMLYHFDTPIELNDFVILDPNWLVEGIKGIVTIEEAKKLKKENPMHATNTQWREFLSSGVLTSQLLELIASVYWKGNEEWRSYFMNLLQQQSLLYKIPGGGLGEEKYVFPPLLPKKPSSSLPPMTKIFTVKLERCYPPFEVYKLSFVLVKRRGWSYDSRSTRYSILLQKRFENEKVTLIGVSCDSSGMRQELSISILEQHKKSSRNKAVMDDLLSETKGEVNTY